MEVVNLLYLSILTKRVPVIPPFLPSHFGTLEDADAMNFGDIFDVPLLSSKLGKPVIEWSELKLLNSPTEGGPGPLVEKIGCWSLHAGNKASGGIPGDHFGLRAFKLGQCYSIGHVVS